MNARLWDTWDERRSWRRVCVRFHDEHVREPGWLTVRSKVRMAQSK